MTYSEKLKDPRWQRRRLEMLEAANWKCQACQSEDKTLHVHHNFYRARTNPWEYPDHAFRVLCESCHENAEFQRRELAESIEGLYHGPGAVEAAIGFIKAAQMQDALDADPNHTELLRNYSQAWGFAAYHHADARDLIERLNNGEVTKEMLRDLWKLQAARLQRRIEMEAKYEEEEATYA